MAVINAGQGALLTRAITRSPAAPAAGPAPPADHYVVRLFLPGPGGVYTPRDVTVDPYFPGHTAASTNNSGDHASVSGAGGPLWPLVLEKAYAQVRGGYQALDRDDYGIGGDHIDQEYSMSALTGLTPRIIGGAGGAISVQNLTAASLVTTLRHLAGSPVTLATRGPTDAERAATGDKIGGLNVYGGHVYALASVDPNGLIHMQNPWGLSDTADQPPALTADQVLKVVTSIVAGGPTSAPAPAAHAATPPAGPPAPAGH
jgi:hypothetical protein